MGMMNRKSYSKWKCGDRVKPVTVTGPGLTKQEFREEADVNVMMKRMILTGQPPLSASTLAPIFADVSDIGCYADVLRRVVAADAAFMELPPEIRTRFNNSPAELVEHLQDGNTLAEVIRTHLKLPPSVAAPVLEAVPPKPK